MVQVRQVIRRTKETVTLTTLMTGQMWIHANTAAYSPNTVNNGYPKQATQQQGKGFFTAPKRSVSGNLVRNVASTFRADYWSQPRLFFNSLLPQEKQFLINAIRFETSHLKSASVKKTVLEQLNKISNEVASQVAKVLGMPAPAPDSKFYHNNTTASVSTFDKPLLSLKGLKVGYLATVATANSAADIKASLAKEGVQLVVVAEILAPGVDMTYSAADATSFDGVIVASSVGKVFSNDPEAASSYYPAGRPLQILQESYRYGKPVGFLGDSTSAKEQASIHGGPGVYTTGSARAKAAPSTSKGFGSMFKSASNSTQGASTTDTDTTVGDMATAFKEGLRTFRFLDRFPVEKM
jgi:catalase